MTSSNSIVLRGGVVLTLDDDDRHRRADVRIDGDRITQIGADLDATGAEVIDTSDAIVSPGLTDSHIHAWQFAWRGVLQRKWGASYIDKLYRMRPSYTPQDTHDAVLGAAYAMLDLGVTGALDYMHGANQTPEHLDAAVGAHRRAGMRVALAVANSVNFDDPRDVVEPARRARLEQIDRLRADDAVTTSQLIELALATINPKPDTIPAMREEFSFARERDLQITMHQNDLGEVAQLYRAELLGSDLVVVHSNPISEKELDWMAQSGVVMSVTSQSETLSGKSMMATRKAFRRGVRLAFGVDSPVFTPLNMRTDLKCVFNALTTLDGDDIYRSIRMPVDPELDPATASFEDVLRAGSVGGAHSIGKGGELGELKVGQLADIAVIHPRDPEPSLADPAAYLLLGAPPADEVRTVIVGGQVRKRDGQLVGIDSAELADINSRVRRRALATLMGR